NLRPLLVAASMPSAGQLTQNSVFGALARPHLRIILFLDRGGVMKNKILLPTFGRIALASPSHSPNPHGISATVVTSLQAKLATVVALADANGGLFSPNRMWSAVVDRRGVLCSVIVTGDAWPGSRSIAIAKASTANDFSNSALALSTANLY